MRRLAAITAFMMLTGLAGAAADAAVLCGPVGGAARIAPCATVGWQIAARDGERATSPVPAAVQPPTSSDSEKICAGGGSGGLDDWIAACDRLIAAGTLPAARLLTAHRFRGNWHQLKRDHARAVADYDTVLRREPGNELAVNSRKASLHAMCNGSGEPATRIAACTRYIGELASTDNDLPTAHLIRAEVYRAIGDLGRASADIEAVLRLDPRDTMALRAKAALTAAGASAQAGGPANAATGRPVVPQVSQDRVPAPAAPATSLTTESRPTPAATIAGIPAAPLPSTPSVAAGSRVALVIGNADYRHATRLANPVNDAGDVASALRKLGFDVVEGRDLDKRALEDKAREFGRKLDRAEIALFFYAGHGLQVAGKNYLVPIDAKLERAGDLSFETIEVTQILAQMEAEQRVNLVFLDACRDNPLARSLARSYGARSGAVSQGLATIHSAIGTMISYATQPDAVALDGDGRNSPFTSALLKHMATKGLEIGSLMRRVRADVVQATRGRQVPWDHSSLIGDVVLAP